MRGEAKLDQSSMWRDLGEHRVIAGAFGPVAPTMANAGGSLMIRVGQHLRRVFDRMIAASSLVANDPVLDVRDFAWTAGLRANWTAIRDEALDIPPLGEAGLATVGEGGEARAVVLYGHGQAIAPNLARCPHTAAAVARIPGLDTAVFSILAPGAQIPAHRGMTKGLVTCHLGLIVPRDGDVRMRVHDRIVRWAEGETLVFDDTYRHAVWNDTSGTRVVLLLQFERPLRNPGKWIADLVLGAVRRSAVPCSPR